MTAEKNIADVEYTKAYSASMRLAGYNEETFKKAQRDVFLGYVAKLTGAEHADVTIDGAELQSNWVSFTVQAKGADSAAKVEAAITGLAAVAAVLPLRVVAALKAAGLTAITGVEVSNTVSGPPRCSKIYDVERTVLRVRLEDAVSAAAAAAAAAEVGGEAFTYKAFYDGSGNGWRTWKPFIDSDPNDPATRALVAAASAVSAAKWREANEPDVARVQAAHRAGLAQEVRTWSALSSAWSRWIARPRRHTIARLLLRLHMSLLDCGLADDFLVKLNVAQAKKDHQANEANEANRVMRLQDKVNEADEAFRAGNYDVALQHYNEAIELAEGPREKGALYTKRMMAEDTRRRVYPGLDYVRCV